ncbi:toxin of the YoeB-YefM toxin-antitoxin system [Planktothrix sp. PCC 11201]|uniref:Txe/YoeB family addiction module toxin n=1 Tax=Planktothrix sp. PCC 11201 TaxID=1729650 RepID=UPI00091A26B6|nr:Txe/YoeB family addiction module toxin [Planktothrix sp. PCC 11201]SKB14881.1 toxin of the YoeB-YefM toxin-antitoxin system [Planktothrix sp. PCC 11201]
MNILFLEDAWQDYLYWQKTDQKILKRINELIKDIQRSPFSGIGKPEALKFNMSGLWSRRIDQEHRLIYQIKDDSIITLNLNYRL